MGNELDQIIDDYYDYTVVVRGRSKKGVNSYIGFVRRFSDWLHERDEEIFSASRSDIEDWLKELFYKQSLVNCSRASMLSALKSFYEFLMRAGYLSGSPAAEVPSPKFHAKAARKFTTEELQLIFAGPDAATLPGLRDRALLVLMYGAGPRVSEISNLELGRLSFTAKTCTVTFLGKGTKERTVKLLDEPTSALKTWYDIRVASKAGQNDFVFISLAGNERRSVPKLSVGALNAILKKYSGRVGIPDPDAFVHKMRSTFATDLYDQGVGVMEIAAKMGHNDIKTTMRYIEISERALNAAVISNKRWKELKGGISGIQKGGAAGNNHPYVPGRVHGEQAKRVSNVQRDN